MSSEQTQDTTSTIQHEIEELIATVEKDPSHRNYWYAYKRIQKLDLDSLVVDEKDSLKVASLSSFTNDQLGIYLDINARQIGLYPEIYIGPFNQYQQAVLDTSSKLYRFEPDMVIFNIHLESMVSQNFFSNFPQLDTGEIKGEMEAVFSRLSGILSTLTENTDAIVLFSNFIVPTFTPFGVLDNKQEIGYREFYRILNQRLEEEYREHSQIYIFDLDQIAADYGKKRLINHSTYYRGTILFSEEFLYDLGHAYNGYVKALKNKNRKCLVLDLDNTLWGGIIGEDGVDGIKLNNNYPGNEFVDFQKLILSYYNRGIILAANSKNNYEDALEAIENHPAMVLREKHFAAMKINWTDKVQNIIDIADELNIGLDSLVFIDDNPVERERVRQSLPQVKVVEMPENPAEYRQTLERLNDFNTFSLTNEDLRRGEMYVARRKRKDMEQNVQSMEDFIRSLEIEAHIKQADDFALPRVTSLVNRTNQFNIATRRYTENQIKDFHEGDEMRIYTLQVEDKFGDEGIVGVAMVRTDDNVWDVDNFMMSCRVIGRKIETGFIYKIINDAKKAGISTITAEYIPTKKNKMTKDFYKDHNFTLVSDDNKTTKWKLEVSEFDEEYPDFIEVIEE